MPVIFIYFLAVHNDSKVKYFLSDLFCCYVGGFVKPQFFVEFRSIPFQTLERVIPSHTGKEHLFPLNNEIIYSGNSIANLGSVQDSDPNPAN
jgi:hypothetical protein